MVNNTKLSWQIKASLMFFFVLVANFYTKIDVKLLHSCGEFSNVDQCLSIMLSMGDSMSKLTLLYCDLGSSFLWSNLTNAVDCQFVCTLKWALCYERTR